MSRFWSPIVKSLSPYVPGEQPKQDGIVKLNTNENPYPPSPRVLTAIALPLNVFAFTRIRARARCARPSRRITVLRRAKCSSAMARMKSSPIRFRRC